MCSYAGLSSDCKNSAGAVKLVKCCYDTSMEAKVKSPCCSWSICSSGKPCKWSSFWAVHASFSLRKLCWCKRSLAACPEAWWISHWRGCSVTGGQPINLSTHLPSMYKRLAVPLVCKEPGASVKGTTQIPSTCVWIEGTAFFNYVFGWLDYRFYCGSMWPHLPGYK